RQAPLGRGEKSRQETSRLTQRDSSGRHGQLTVGFQSANSPDGFSLHTQACSTYQLSTGFRMCRDCPNTTGGVVFPAASHFALGTTHSTAPRTSVPSSPV